MRSGKFNFAHAVLITAAAQPFEGVIVMSDIVVCDFAYGREDSGAFLLLTSPKPE
jgi:hypothetical protein